MVEADHTPRSSPPSGNIALPGRARSRRSRRLHEVRPADLHEAQRPESRQQPRLYGVLPEPRARCTLGARSTEPGAGPTRRSARTARSLAAPSTASASGTRSRCSTSTAAGCSSRSGTTPATVSIAEPYAGLMSLSPTDATTTVNVNVVKGDGDDCRAGSRSTAARRTARHPDGLSVLEGRRRPASRATLSRGPPPAVAPRAAAVYPDLQSLPAYRDRAAPGTTSRSPPPCGTPVRRRWSSTASAVTDEDLMDAVPVLLRRERATSVGHDARRDDGVGRPRTVTRTGTSRDFARYRLLDADKEARRAQPQGGVLPGQHRRRRLHRCRARTGTRTTPTCTRRAATYTSMAVREVLDAGNGDTYYQDLPGPVVQRREPAERHVLHRGRGQPLRRDPRDGDTTTTTATASSSCVARATTVGSSSRRRASSGEQRRRLLLSRRRT